MAAERVFQKIQIKMSSGGGGFIEANSSAGRAVGITEETLNLPMTANQPPILRWKVRWLRCEEFLDDWTILTTIEASKRGPLLKSRLMRDAYMHKEVLDNKLLQDPAEGVNYFKNALTKYFLEGTTNVQNPEFLIFASNFDILLKRLKASWNDLMPTFAAQSPEFLASDLLFSTFPFHFLSLSISFPSPLHVVPMSFPFAVHPL